MLDSVGKAFVEACSQRIDITPPGHYGVISLVSDTGTAQTRFPSSLVSSGGVGGLGARVALSSATLVKESSDEGRNVVTSFLDGLSGEGSAVVGAALPFGCGRVFLPYIRKGMTHCWKPSNRF